MSVTNLAWQCFRFPKEGMAAEECEDAVAGDAAAARFAVADGATESYAAGDWARLLVEAYVRDPSPEWLAGPRKEWQSRASASALSWYAEEKVVTGGHAAFVGVVVADNHWRAVACGDSCVIHWSGGAVSSFPILRSQDFNSSPSLVVTRGPQPNWKTAEGELRPGDRLYLATDALAQCLLASAEDGLFVGHELLDLEEDDVRWWVAAARAGGRLRNDDVALGVITRE